MDPSLSRQAHAQLRASGATECGCDGCLNFEAYRDELLRSPLGNLLRSLGIEPAWEVEIYQFGQTAPGEHAYGGFYHFVGELLSGGPAWVGSDKSFRTAEFERLAPNIEVGVHTDCSLVREPFRGLPLVQLEVSLRLPWVISLPEPA